MRLPTLQEVSSGILGKIVLTYIISLVPGNAQFEIFDFKKFKIFKRKKNSNLYNCNTSSLSYRYFSIEFVPAPDLKLYILILF